MIEPNVVNSSTVNHKKLSPKLIELPDHVERISYNLQETQVRWFYKDVSDKRWTQFSGCDSLNLEAAFRTHCLSHRSDVVDESGFSDSEVPSPRNRTDTVPSKKPRSTISATSRNVSVRGGLYDVDVTTRLGTPIYWSSDKAPIRALRGLWFRDVGSGVYDPLDDEALMEHLENEYRSLFSGCEAPKDSFPSIDSPHQSVQVGGVQPKGFALLQTVASAPMIFNEAANGIETENVEAQNPPTSPASTSSMTHCTSVESKRKMPLRTVRFTDCHVDFHSPNEIYLYQDSTTLYIRQKLGMQKVGTRLYRGYNELASADDKPPAVSHLCFVIHGIGQKMGTNNIHKCCSELRENCTKLQSKYFTDPEYTNQRVEFLPIEWRSSLQLDGDTVESITPFHVRGLRTILNSSAMDIMYYTSPLYRAEMSSSLLAELNRMYALFCSRNPEFESRGGKVSVIAHSLGCVLVYDLITGWSQPFDQVGSPRSSTSPQEPDVNGGGSREFPVDEAGPIEGTEEVKRAPVSGHNSPITSLDRNQSEVNAEEANLSSRNLQQVARVSQQLEAARTVVNQLEHELSALLQPKASSVVGSGFGDKGTGSDNPSSNFPIPDSVMSADRNGSYFSGNSLRFKSNLENFFCLGSPLPVYLTLRGIRPGAYTTQDNIMPKHLCRRIFNVYHPSDPVAYRLEPLVLKRYTSIQPALIHRAEATDQPDYDELPLIASSGEEVRRSVVSDPPRTSTDATDSTEPQEQQRAASASPNRQPPSSPDSRRFSFASRVLGFFTRSGADADHSTEGEPSPHDPLESVTNDAIAAEFKQTDPSVLDRNSRFQAGELAADFEDPNAETAKLFSDQHNGVQTKAEEQYPDLQLEHRLDYQLRASRYESFYISILTAHTSYWTNADVGMLILSQLFRSS